MKIAKKIDRCRACGGESLTPIFDMGPQFLHTAFEKEGVCGDAAERYPTEVLLCAEENGGCGLAQAAVAAPRDRLYANYWLRSGASRSGRAHLRELAEDVFEVAGRESANVLDIGCNDGALLSCFPSEARRYGVDPCEIARMIGPWAQIANEAFPNNTDGAPFDGVAFDIVTSIAVLATVEDPSAFACAVRDMLAPNGVWVIETPHWAQLVEAGAYDALCHEELSFFSLQGLERLIENAGLRVVRAQANGFAGGRLRVWAVRPDYSGPEDSGWADATAQLRGSEAVLGLGSVETYQAFKTKAEAQRRELGAFLEEISARGETVHVYGASTRGNVILQYCGIDRAMAPIAAARNPLKAGTRIPGANIDVVSEPVSRTMRPDYYLVMPWAYPREVLEREREIIFEGTKLIFPLPELRVVCRESYAMALAEACATCETPASTQTLRALAMAGGGFVDTESDVAALRQDAG